MTLREAAKRGYMIQGLAYFENFKEYYQCGRKIKHDNLHFAIIHIESLKAVKGMRNKKSLHIYLCPYCDGFHVAHGRV